MLYLHRVPEKQRWILYRQLKEIDQTTNKNMKFEMTTTYHMLSHSIPTHYFNKATDKKALSCSLMLNTIRNYKYHMLLHSITTQTILTRQVLEQLYLYAVNP